MSDVLVANPLAVAKVRVEELGRLLLDHGSPDIEDVRARTAGIAGLAWLAGQSTLSESLASRRRTELRSIEPVKSERFVWMAFGTTSNRRVRRMMNYGGVFPGFQTVPTGFRFRVLVPSSSPASLKESIISYCSADSDADELWKRMAERCHRIEALKAGSVENFLVVEIQNSEITMPAESSRPASGSAVGAFGFDAPTAAWESFVAHSHGAVYSTFEKMRRTASYRQLERQKAALAHSDGTKASWLSMQSMVEAQRYLEFAAADASKYVDVAALHRPDPDSDATRAFDLVSTPTRPLHARSTKDEDRSPGALMPELESPRVSFAWGFDDRVSGGESGSSSHPVRELLRENGLPEWVSRINRYRDSLVSSSMAVLGSSLMEAPGPMVQSLVSALSSASIPEPERVAGAFGVQPKHDTEKESSGGVLPLGGLAISWSADPERPAVDVPEQVGGADIESEWMREGQQETLLVAVGASVDALFNETRRVNDRFFAVDLAEERIPLEDMGPTGRIFRQVQTPIEQYAGVRRLFLSGDHAQDNRVARVQVGGETRNPPARYPATQSGESPSSASLKYQRCRHRHINAAVAMRQELEDADSSERWPIMAEAHVEASSMLDRCAERYPAHATEFRAAKRSWLNWAGDWMFEGFRYLWAHEFWNLGCPDRSGSQWSCNRLEFSGALAGWSHLPALETRPKPRSSYPTNERWTVRMHRDGSGRVFASASEGASDISQGFETPSRTPEAVEKVKRQHEREASGTEIRFRTRSMGSGAREGPKMESLVTLAPDALTRTGALEQVFQYARELKTTGLRMVVADEFRFPGVKPPEPEPAVISFRRALPEWKKKSMGWRRFPRPLDDLELVSIITIQPDSIEIRHTTPNRQESGASSAQDSHAVQLSLRDEKTDIRRVVDDAIEGVEGASSPNEVPAEAQIRAFDSVGRAYPLVDLHRVMTTRSRSTDSEFESGRRIGIRVHRDVPIQAVASVLSAAMLERKGGPFADFDSYSKATVATSERGSRTHKEYLFEGWKVTILPSNETSEGGQQ